MRIYHNQSIYTDNTYFPVIRTDVVFASDAVALEKRVEELEAALKAVKHYAEAYGDTYLSEDICKPALEGK